MYDLIVLGGGPAGYLAAERAAHKGLKTVCIEKRELGGVCLNEGCIPSKALLYSAKVYENASHGEKYGVKVTGITLDHSAVIARKAKVVKALVGGVRMKLKANGVEVIMNNGEIIGKQDGGYAVKAGDTVYVAKNLIIATGSSPVVPPIPGLKEGIASGFVATNREALEFAIVPKEFVIIGGGVIGLEMASYYKTAGSNVTVIEMLDHIAGPTDSEISEQLLKEYKAKGVNFILGAKVTSLTNNSVLFETKAGTQEVKADKVLLSIGRRANVQGIGLETIKVDINRSGIITDDKMRTNIEGVYAAGDVNGKSMLAHTAYREAEVAVNTILGKRDTMRYHAIPSVIYTQPEVASVGYTEDGAKEAGIQYELAKLSMKYAGRFVAENDGDGLCKVLIDKKYRSIIGVHMIGSYASEIIWGAAQMIELELRVQDAREIVFPHPTVSEIIRETLWEFKD